MLQSVLEGIVVWRDGWDLAIDTRQLIDAHLGRLHRILHRKDDIIWNLAVVQFDFGIVFS